jgi:hypothetical protein
MSDATVVRGPVRGGRLVRCLALVGLILNLVGSVQAGTVVPGPAADPQGDFLPTFTGPHNSDLDVRLAQVFYDAGAQTLTFQSQMWGTIGQTPTGFYVWGIDHGHGTEQFQAPTSLPNTGAGVFFDQVVIVRPTPQLSSFNLTAQIFTTTVLNDTISLTVPISLVPATQPGDLPIERWSFNLWPRSGAGGNVVIADFAPDAANVLATVPEPLSVIAMGSGVGVVLLLSAMRRPWRARV